MENENLKESLEALGYNQEFEPSRLEQGALPTQLARVIAEHLGAYDIITPTGEYRAVVTGQRMQIATCRDDYPAVGDWVIIKADSSDQKVIETILPRLTVLRKKYSGREEAQIIAANLDVIFIVEAADRDFNLNRFERYLVLAREGGIMPVIILNKSDLLSNLEQNQILEQLQQRFAGVEVLCTSTVTEEGLTTLANYLKPKLTYSFLGSSGVGKSSLINQLLEAEMIKTKAIGAKTGRGKHTTTARAMYFTKSGGIIIDNPGSREVGLVDSSLGITAVFPNFEKLASRCKFADCQHQGEPGCAIQEAINNGQIEPAQFEHYLKLRRETEHFELSNYEKRQKDRQFGKYLKIAKRDFE